MKKLSASPLTLFASLFTLTFCLTFALLFAASRARADDPDACGLSVDHNCDCALVRTNSNGDPTGKCHVMYGTGAPSSCKCDTPAAGADVDCSTIPWCQVCFVDDKPPR